MGHAPFQSVKCGQDCVNEDGIKGRASLTAAETFIMSGGGDCAARLSHHNPKPCGNLVES